VQVTLEEGTCAAWLHDLLKPHVANVVVCDPRQNALLQAGNKNDQIDARKLADLLRTGLLSPVYHAENGLRALRELARGYLALNRDVRRATGPPWNAPFHAAFFAPQIRPMIFDMAAKILISCHGQPK
jgi:transposase